MTSKELLQPRFKVIADYPYSEYPIGLVLVKELTHHFTYTKDDKKYTTNIKDINYPHLFKKLNWFEERKKEEMPKRLICKVITDDTEIIEIEEWDMEIMVGWTNKEKRECCSLLSFNYEYGYFPVD